MAEKKKKKTKPADKEESSGSSSRKSSTPSGSKIKAIGKWLRRFLKVFPAAAALVLVGYLILFHTVRGNPVENPDDWNYGKAVSRLNKGLLVDSQQNMDDIGAVANRAVDHTGLDPGPFKVLFLPELDTLEKLHHYFHSPFTGLADMYTDIWLNSCTTYGRREETWATQPARVRPADRLSILIILIDRLKRQKTLVGEHTGAYFEVFAGMELHSLPGRARCYDILFQQCAADPGLTRFVLNQLKKRNFKALDESEIGFWNYMAQRPTREGLTVLAESDTPPAKPALRKRINCVTIFRKILVDYR